MCHVLCTHDLVRPFAIHVVQLIDLEPRSDTRGGARVVNGAKEEVRYGARMAALVPLHLYCVALGRGNSISDTLLAIYVAGDVVASNVGLSKYSLAITVSSLVDTSMKKKHTTGLFEGGMRMPT